MAVPLWNSVRDRRPIHRSGSRPSPLDSMDEAPIARSKTFARPGRSAASAPFPELVGGQGRAPPMSENPESGPLGPPLIGGPAARPVVAPAAARLLSRPPHPLPVLRALALHQRAEARSPARTGPCDGLPAVRDSNRESHGNAARSDSQPRLLHRGAWSTAELTPFTRPLRLGLWSVAKVLSLNRGCRPAPQPPAHFCNA
jgi:hypothetical protein